MINMVNNSWLMNMVLIEDITTQAIPNPIHPLTTDVSIDTVDSEEKMAGSHITEFHTHEDEQPSL